MDNKWVKYYASKISNDTDGIQILNNIKGETFTVHFPEFKSPIKSQCHAPEIKTFTITFECNDIENGFISVQCAVSNINLWMARGYVIEY